MPTVVEEEWDEDGRPKYIVSSDKFKVKWIVRKSEDGFAFYEIVCTKGKLAKELQSKFTTSAKALDAVKSYIDRSSVSNTVAVERNYEERHGAAGKSNDKKHVQQRASN